MVGKGRFGGYEHVKIFKGPFKVCLKLGDIAAAPARLTW